MPHVILFEHVRFHGAHKHVFVAEPNLNASDDRFFNDKVSSAVVLDGRWAFFRHGNFSDLLGVLGPGNYPSLQDVGIANDAVSSLRPAVGAEAEKGLIEPQGE
ncbi:beta/gamma crystallin-related protein [Amycolatopsis coloradensis]|uniref:beta/gamma crystallin-related protein n=1 Tax=Amycolatopsis coloradensis TaxID=76021 RepID=UPI003CC91F76